MAAAATEIPRSAEKPPSDRPASVNGQALERADEHNVPSIAPENACDEPAPSAPHGAGRGAIAKDSNGGEFDKVYGVRPKTTWHLKPRTEMSLWEWIAAIDTCPPDIYRKREDDEVRGGPPPRQPIWKENVFIVSLAAIPLSIHYGWNLLFPNHLMHWAPAFVLYHYAFIFFATRLIDRLHTKMIEYGVFDETNRGRDMVDDKHVNHLGRSIFIYTVLRTVQPFFAAWRGDMVNPFVGLSIWTPVKIGLWQIALDYWFYLYHRSTHEFDSLWWVHRQHHATKHPTPILSILADDVQECLEVIIVPFLATVSAPHLTFPEFHLTIMYTLYVEALGHSGVRAVWEHPILAPVLKPFGAELAVEDHDLHHRFGRSGKNYGKQTRIFDRLFGTVGERIETPVN